MAKPLFEVNDKGQIHWHPHKYQVRALKSKARFPFILKGWRGGFTSWAAKLLETEMKRCGPGNLNKSYFAISPTHKVGEKGLVPAIQTVFETYLNFAKYNKNDHVFTITPEGERALWGHSQPEPTKIVCCYAEDADSFASATFIAGVADEVGQKKFKSESWSALRARLSTASGEDAPGGGGKMGRIFSGSTVYQLNWLEDMWNDWQAAVKVAQAEMLEAVERESDPMRQLELRKEFNRRAYNGQVHPEYDFIRFDSTANPAFPQAEFDALRERLPAWFFDMRYRAIFRKPAGVIFESWDRQKHFIRPFKIPSSWPRRLSVDFGRKNFYAVFWAYDEDRDRHFAYASYHRTDRQIFEHAEALHAFEPNLESAVGGQVSEDYERSQMAAGGVVCMAPPFKSLWTGVGTLDAAITLNKVFVFQNEQYAGMPVLPEGFQVGCEGMADELRSYSRPVDENGEVQQDEDPEDKEEYHWVDNGRYYGSRNLVHLTKAGAPVSGRRAENPGQIVVPQASTAPASGRGMPVSGSVARGTAPGTFNLNRDRVLGVRGGDRFLD